MATDWFLDADFQETASPVRHITATGNKMQQPAQNGVNFIGVADEITSVRVRAVPDTYGDISRSRRENVFIGIIISEIHQ